jgi:hypothetical protein
LGHVIFGADQETLEGNVLASLERKGWKLVVMEANTGGQLSRQLASAGSSYFAGGKIMAALADDQPILNILEDEMKSFAAQAALGLIARPTQGKSEVDIFLITPERHTSETRGYGGHPKNVAEWGANSALNLLRSEIS